MPRCLNRVELIGALGADPEVRYTVSGHPVATASLATNEAWTDKSTGERKEDTQWHRLVFWRGLAETVDQYTRKGSRLWVAGRLKTRKWQDSDGRDRYTTEVEVSDMILLGDAPSSGPAPAAGPSRPADHQRPPARPPAGKRPTADYQAPAGQGAGLPFDDDIPF